MHSRHIRLLLIWLDVELRVDQRVLGVLDCLRRTLEYLLLAWDHLLGGRVRVVLDFTERLLVVFLL